MPHSTYLPEHMGSATLDLPGPFVAGCYASLRLTYTAGTFGIDDSGMLKISWRTTSDMAKPQFKDPAAPNYTTVEASNGAVLEYWFDRLNIRPWVNTLLIRVGRGYCAPATPSPFASAIAARARKACGCRPIARSASSSRPSSMPSRHTSSPSCRVRPASPWCRARLQAGRRSGLRWPSRASHSGWRWSPRTCGAIRPAKRNRRWFSKPSRAMHDLPRDAWRSSAAARRWLSRGSLRTRQAISI